MRLIVKTILYNKKRIMMTLVILLLAVLMSLQITVTLYSKNQSLAQRVDAVRGAHTNVYLTMNGTLDIDKLVAGIGSFESTYAIGYHTGNENSDLFLEGYINDQTNLFPVMQGKPLAELEGYEIAVTESYARSLVKLGLQPLGHQITIRDDTFTVESIVDYPNYNDAFVGKSQLKDIKLFNYPILSVGLANYHTVKEIAEENPYDFGNRILYKVRYDHYSSDQEQYFVQRLGNEIKVWDPFLINVSPLFEIAQLSSVADILFRFISVFVLAGLMLSSAYTFYIFLRKQLMQDAKTIGALVLQGVYQNKIMFSYFAQILLITVSALILFGVMNIGILEVLKQNRSLAPILDCNQIILLRTLLAFAGYLLVIFGLFLMQLKRYMKQAFQMTKTADHTYGPSSRLQSKNYALQLAWKGLLANRINTLGSILSMTMIIITLLITLQAKASVDHIYNEDTLGIHFDYIVGRTSFLNYDGVRPFAKEQAWIDKTSDVYFLDIDFDTYRRTYYKSNFLVFYNSMEGFVKPVSGEAPYLTESQKYRHYYRARYRFLASSRRHMDARGLRLYDVNDVSVPIEKQYIFYLDANYPGNTESGAPINATVNTLIDNGWIAFILEFRSEKDYDNRDQFVDMFLVNAKDEENKSLLEAYFAQHDMEYMSFNEVIDKLNETNQDVNQTTIWMMQGVLGLLLALWLVNEVMAVQCNLQDQQINHRFLKRIGIRDLAIRRKVITQEVLVIGGSLLFGGMAYLGIQPLIREGLLKAYGLYNMPELSGFWYVLYGSLLVVIAAGLYMLRKPYLCKTVDSFCKDNCK